ncbi:MAG: TonB-dependent receptor [Gemmatimonadales bacterium]|nr:TonB-dependent receptor [Gemmatimonadales bacterium]
MDVRRWAPIALAIIVPLLPQTVSAQTYGQLRGRIITEETRTPLENARIAVIGQSLAITTGVNGQFVLDQVPSGSHTIRISYIGRQPVTRTVEIRAGETTIADVALGLSVATVADLAVIGSRSMSQAEALNIQKNAPNIINVVASDQIGRFPDISAPEAVQRLPGVVLARDQGEGRYLQIRGGSAANTQVTYNGLQIPAPEGEVRQIALDAVPVDLLEAIEVAKAILPSMDADAVGGAVNLVTKRAPLTRLVSFEAAGGFSTLRERTAGSVTGTFGDRFAEGRFGLLLTGSFNRRPFGSDNVEAAYDLGDPGLSDDALETLEVRHYTLTRTRQGATAVFDFRPSERNVLTLSGIYSKLADDEQRRVLVNEVEDGELNFEHRDRYEHQQILGVSFQGEHLFRRSGLFDYQIGYTRGSEDQPRSSTIAFVQEDVSFAPSLSRTQPRANPAGGALAGSYLFDEIEQNTYATRNGEWLGATNLALPYRLGRASGQIRMGLRLRSKHKTAANLTEVAELADGDLILGSDVGSAFNGVVRHPGVYPLPPFSTMPDDIRSFRNRFSARLEDEIILEEETSDFDLKERVTAAYLMSEINLTPSLTILPGVRYEHTKLNSSGFSWNSETETLAPQQATNSYGNVFPMVHVRYAVTPRTNLRAAFTTAIARPNYFDLVPYRLRDDEDLALGNPSLSPTTSRNIDLLVEHYADQIGILSAGVFFKQLSDPIFVFREDNDLGGETEQPRNGRSGWIRGFEASLQRQLRFLPSPFNGLGLYANYTFTDSEATLPDGRVARLQGQTRHVANAALSYERRGFSAQLSLNYNDRYVDEYGEEAAEDILVDRHVQLDASASLRLPARATVFAELVNLTNEPYRVFQGDPSRPVQIEYYARWGRMGVRLHW